MLGNTLDELVNSSKEKDIIGCCYQNRHGTSFGVSAREKNRVASHSELEEGMEGANGDMSVITYLYWGTINYNR